MKKSKLVLVSALILICATTANAQTKWVPDNVPSRIFIPLPADSASGGIRRGEVSITPNVLASNVCTGDNNNCLTASNFIPPASGGLGPTVVTFSTPDRGNFYATAPYCDVSQGGTGDDGGQVGIVPVRSNADGSKDYRLYNNQQNHTGQWTCYYNGAPSVDLFKAPTAPGNNITGDVVNVSSAGLGQIVTTHVDSVTGAASYAITGSVDCNQIINSVYPACSAYKAGLPSCTYGGVYPACNAAPPVDTGGGGGA